MVLEVPITWFYNGFDVGPGTSSMAPELTVLRDPEVLRFVGTYYCIKDVAARARLRGMASVLASGK